MNYLNTNKSLFCGTRYFSSKAMTEDEFLRCLNKFLTDNGGEEISDLTNDSIDKAYEIIVEVFEEDEDYYEIIDLFEINKDYVLEDIKSNVTLV